MWRFPWHRPHWFLLLGIKHATFVCTRSRELSYCSKWWVHGLVFRECPHSPALAAPAFCGPAGSYGLPSRGFPPLWAGPSTQTTAMPGPLEALRPSLIQPSCKGVSVSHHVLRCFLWGIVLPPSGLGRSRLPLSLTLWSWGSRWSYPTHKPSTWCLPYFWLLETKWKLYFNNKTAENIFWKRESMQAWTGEAQRERERISSWDHDLSGNRESAAQRTGPSKCPGNYFLLTPFIFTHF